LVIPLFYFFILNETGLFSLPGVLTLFALVIALSALFLYFSKRKKKTSELYLSDDEQTNFLKSILDHSASGNAIIDSEGFIRYLNFGFIALFDEKEVPLLGRNIKDIPQLNKLQRSFDNSISSVIEMLDKEGNRCMLKFFTVKDSSENVVGRFLKVLPDIGGDDKTADLDLSHELKTPLHAVLGFSELLNKDSDLKPDQQKLLEKIIYHSKLLDGKIKNLVGVHESESNVSASELPENGVKKILVVDDVSINRTLLKLMLKRYGIDVEEASNGEAALKILEGWKADMILMDLSMPVMDGIETVKAIRKNGTNGHSASKIIAVTATQRYSRDELIAVGFDDLMQKPFKEEELLSRIGIQPPVPDTN